MNARRSGSQGSELACLLQDLASGFMSGKLLQKLDTSAYILAHHTSDNFAFLDDPVNARNRTTFYHTLARLLFMDESASKFKSFVAPLQQVGSLWGPFLELNQVIFHICSRCHACGVIAACCSGRQGVGGLSVAHWKSTWRPCSLEKQSAGAGAAFFLVLGRLKPGAHFHLMDLCVSSDCANVDKLQTKCSLCSFSSSCSAGFSCTTLGSRLFHLLRGCRCPASTQTEAKSCSQLRTNDLWDTAAHRPTAR